MPRNLRLLLLATLPSSLATIISDGGFACIFNANGVAATTAQRGVTTPPLLSASGAYDVRAPQQRAPRSPPLPRPPWRSAHPPAAATAALSRLPLPTPPPTPPPRRPSTSAARRTQSQRREEPGR